MATGGDHGDISTAFHEFADKEDHKEISTANTVKWMKKANCFGTACSSNSVDIAFMKVKKDKKKKNINFDEFKELIDVMSKDYCKDKKKEQTVGKEEMTQKLASCKNVAVGTKTSKTGNVGGMTDTKNYTGAHKARFGEDGKGKGVDGRQDRHDNDGYVGNYKGKGTHSTKK